jgi:hypothetical protein
VQQQPQQPLVMAKPYQPQQPGGSVPAAAQQSFNAQSVDSASAATLKTPSTSMPATATVTDKDTNRFELSELLEFEQQHVDISAVMAALEVWLSEHKYTVDRSKSTVTTLEATEAGLHVNFCPHLRISVASLHTGTHVQLNYWCEVKKATALKVATMTGGLSVLFGAGSYAKHRGRSVILFAALKEAVCTAVGASPRASNAGPAANSGGGGGLGGLAAQLQQAVARLATQQAAMERLLHAPSGVVDVSAARDALRAQQETTEVLMGLM